MLINQNPYSKWLEGSDFDEWVPTTGIPEAETLIPEMVWADLETTGLVSGEQGDVVLELGLVLTDKVGRLIPDGVAEWLVFDATDAARYLHSMSTCSPEVADMHIKSGLFADIRAAVDDAEIQKRPGFLSKFHIAGDARRWLDACCLPSEKYGSGPTSEGEYHLSGSSPQFDRRFMMAELPALEDWFYYRNGADVSGIRYLQRKHIPGSEATEPKAEKKHRVIPDIIDSITLYRHQLRTFFRLPPEVEKML